jgi:hypothetical protein
MMVNWMDRIYHPWDKWECYHYGFWNTQCPNGMKAIDGMKQYSIFLSNLDEFEKALESVISKWKYSCEHNLTNENMNRIAWLGQASIAYAMGIPACCRGGYSRMNDEQKVKADNLAMKYLNRWLVQNGYDEVSEDTVQQKTKQPKF